LASSHAQRCPGIPGVGPLTDLADDYSTAGLVALARKIARPCFILLMKESNLRPNFRSSESRIGKKIIKFS
jgi:hypothetical protein